MRIVSRVLIVEDNSANLELMRYILSASGHTVIAAVNGQSGLEAARLERPDVIICDVQLPEMDGYEVARWLKSDPQLRKVPLIAVTALAMVGDRDRLLASGFDGYLAKPIDPQTFVPQIEVFLRPEQHTRPWQREVAPAAESVPSGIGLGHTILVVDNLPMNLDLARSILAPSGYKIITASTMAEGLALARQNRIDLILSDVCMSGGSGYDFIRAVMANPALRAIPFVFITSTMLDDKDRDKGLALGAALFLLRPIEPEIFLAQIESCLLEKGMNLPWRSS